MPTPSPSSEARADRLRERFGGTLVDDFLMAGGQVGRSYLSGDEDLVFGFLQRVLAHLRIQDKRYGLIFPKIDRAYRRMFDYFDGDGRIFVIYPGTDGPDMLPVLPEWTRDLGDYHEIPEEYAADIVLAFLEVYAHLRFDHAERTEDLREHSPRPDNRG